MQLKFNDFLWSCDVLNLVQMNSNMHIKGPSMKTNIDQVWQHAWVSIIKWNQVVSIAVCSRSRDIKRRQGIKTPETLRCLPRRWP